MILQWLIEYSYFRMTIKHELDSHNMFMIYNELKSRERFHYHIIEKVPVVQLLKMNIEFLWVT